MSNRRGGRVSVPDPIEWVVQPPRRPGAARKPLKQLAGEGKRSRRTAFFFIGNRETFLFPVAYGTGTCTSVPLL